MSGNINDTNIERVRKDVENMKSELRDMKSEYTLTNSDISELEYKYRYLYKTSKTLFNFILKKGSNPHEFDDEYFNRTIDFMLNQIHSIQQSTTSQYDASANVSYHLAKKYIPQYKNHK